MILIGIDPGKTGYLAALDHTGEPLGCLPTPYNGDQPDLLGMNQWLYDILEAHTLIHGAASSPIRAAIEHVNSFGMGRQSAFVFGQGFGALQAWVTVRALPLTLVTPKTWQKAVFVGLPKRDDNSVIFTRRRWPAVNLLPGRCTKPKDGLADALCIAEWLRRQ